MMYKALLLFFLSFQISINSSQGLKFRPGLIEDAVKKYFVDKFLKSKIQAARILQTSDEEDMKELSKRIKCLISHQKYYGCKNFVRPILRVFGSVL